MAKASKSLRPAAAPVPAPVQAPVRGELIDATEFALIGEPTSLAALEYNLAQESISEFDLDRVKIPAGGATVWQVPGLEGISNHEAIEGIIVSISVRRAFWESSFDGSNTPPDCSSTDGFRGVGDPGGECSACPFNEFGSAVKQNGQQGRGKRCQERRIILLIRPEDRLPLAISAPPTSIKNIKQFLMRLPVPMYQAVVRLELEVDKNADGVAFSKVVPSYVGHIAAEHGKALRGYAETLKRSIVAQAPRGSEVVDGSASEHEESTDPQGGGAETIPD